LTGEGSDEFLAGYNIFKEAKIRRFWARQPQSEIRPLLLSKLYGYIGGLSEGNTAYLEKFFGKGLTDVSAADYSHAIRWRNNQRTRRIFSPDLQSQMSSANPIEAIPLPAGFANWHPQSRAQYLEITLFLGEYLLSSQGDRMAAANSVEGRVPFLDHRVIEFANTLPPHYKLRGLNEKYILKQAMRDLLPENIWNRPKRPYRAPIHRSFFPNGKPLDWVAEILQPDKVAEAGYFNVTAVAALTRKIERLGTLGETDDMTLAGLLSTMLVHQQFVSDFTPLPPIGGGDDIKEVVKCIEYGV
ncbi:MAG: asparagine synthetase B, partial [Anaerolineales bacterium]|nr:asparagine synthetase B [Anaerolineales bacterium]